MIPYLNYRVKPVPALLKYLLLIIGVQGCLTTKKPERLLDKSKKAVRTSRYAYCPAGMIHVISRVTRVSVCVDIYELTIAKNWNLSSSKPAGHMSYYDCKRLCKKYGKRLLTHKEWLTACEGTKPKDCNINQRHPIIESLKRPHWVVKGMNCRRGNLAWGLTCMNDPNINLTYGLARNDQFSRCRSRFGIRHMVGNLGEWVEETMKRRHRIVGRFNGGLYPQKKSSCQYTTIAHGHRYRDYSIGCRCGRKPYYRKWSPGH